jgi:transposase-like protein/IS1 family transposase
MKRQDEPMDASTQFCPNEACAARGIKGAGNIRVHGYHPQRYRCSTCKQTFSARRGTMLEGLRTPAGVVVVVVTLLCYGCPMQAIVHAFDLDERTVADWQQRAGKHCQRTHEALVERGNVTSSQVQADEIRAKGRRLIAWMALAIDATSRLWLAGVVHERRDRALADRLFQHVRACCGPIHALLVCTDGWAPYPKSIMRAFREKVKKTAGRGRCCLERWPGLCIATVIKRTEKKRVVEITRTLALGAAEEARSLLTMTTGCMEFNTSLIERFNGTMRERLAALTRKCRHAAQCCDTLERGMYLVGCTYNVCWAHHELSNKQHFGYPCSPAMAAGLTDHLWSVAELLSYTVAPAPWVAPKRRGRPRKAPLPEVPLPKRPPGRPRTTPLLPSTG